MKELKELDEDKIEKIVNGKDEEVNKLLAKAGMFSSILEFEQNVLNNDTLKFF